MVFENIVQIIEGANWVTLFVWLIIGVVFAPINRESIIIFMGVLSSVGTINPVYAFFITTMATFIGYSIGYILAKAVKRIFFNKPSPVVQQRIKRSNQLLEKYGTFAVVISYYIPGARHFLPVIVGLGKMGIGRFLASSFAGAFIWTISLFFPAYYLGENWQVIINNIFRAENITVWFIFIIIMAAIVWFGYFNRKRKLQKLKKDKVMESDYCGNQ
ncbi:MAG: DedA family protein [Bacillota bacterium]